MKYFLLAFAIFLITACAPTAYKPSQFNNQYNPANNSNFNNNDYRFVFLELWHTQETTKKYAWEIMPPGNKAFAISQYGVWNKKDRNFGTGPSFFAFSSKGLEDAKIKSINYCKSVAKESKYLFTGKVDPNTCKVHIAYNSNEPKKSLEQINQIAKQRQLENEYGRYIKQCEYIGFKRNTDKMGDCVLQMYSTEIKLAQLNAQQRTADSSDVLTNMFLLNESLKLLNPPQPRTTTCQARPFGVYMNIYCN